MAEWLKAKLFGRQLSYGSETEEPTTFEEALQSNAVPNIQPLQQQQAMPTLEGLQLNVADEVSRCGTTNSEWYLQMRL